MFGFLRKKKKSAIPELLDKIERLEEKMRDAELNAAAAYLEGVFDKLDDTALKLTENQESSIELYLDDMDSHISEYYLELIKYECDEIILRAENGALLSEEEERAKDLEHSDKKCTAEIAEREAQLREYGLSDIDRIKLENELAELKAKHESILNEYKGK